MPEYYGDFPEDATVRIEFNTFSSDDPSASVTITNLADADIMVHKDGSLTQIATDGATVVINFDGVTGNHQITIDTSVDAAYSTGSDYAVRIEGTTVDGGTINAWIGSFSIENRSSSLSATALANLIKQYDTTGLTGDTFPANQAQVGNLSTGSGGISTTSESATITTGSETLTVAATIQADGILHEIADAAGNTEFYYQFDVGGSGVPQSVEWEGFVQSNGDTVDVSFWNWVGSSWEQVDTLSGANGTTIVTETFKPTIAHVGTGANLGKVRMQFISTTSTNVATDRILCTFTNVDQALGFEGGAVWYDDVGGTAGQAVGVGHLDKPSSVEADAKAIADANNLRIIHCLPASTFVMEESMAGFEFIGARFTLTTAGFSLANALVQGAMVSGIYTGTPNFSFCSIGNITGSSGNFHVCGFSGTVLVDAAGDWFIHHCYSKVAGGTTPVFDFGTDVGVSSNVTFADYHNGITFNNYNNSGTDLLSLSGAGQVVYGASSSGTVQQRGDWKVTNTGGVTIVEDDNTSKTAAILVDTADMQPKLGTPAGASISADILVIDNFVDGIESTLGTPAGASMSADILVIDNFVDGIESTLGVAGAGLTDLGGMSTAMKAEIYAAAMQTQMTEGYAANSVAPTAEEAQFAIHQMLMQFGIVTTTLTVRKLDNTTTAFVVTLDDATSPTDAKRV